MSAVLLRRADQRPRTRIDWLDSRHTFSFGQHHDPAWMGFGALRVINDDRVAAGAGFPPHRHANMEIISIVLEGALAHRDSTGTQGVIRAGDVQWMSAGHGIEHSEFNASPDAPVHFLQVWIQPDQVNAAPAYAQEAFDPALREGRWQDLVGGDGIAIRQDARIRAIRLQEGASQPLEVAAGRGLWLQVLDGAVRIAGHELAAGDGIGLVGPLADASLQAVGACEVLGFDVPM
ncbi:pirin family protein [Solilutibacter silvestris]|uniref:Pirin-related protein n=1 Tax=Solilutibacter silvestris TaxID=1645665 RepID=A0A2K1Q0C8_9GAMM|nr:pirin family protein [Lysobacter silvestris]PNS08496.1 Pirin-related protein [Lysobacter silvestris]